MKFKDKLKKLRVKNGYSQKQIADMLGVCRSTYTYYETGKTEPSLQSVVILSDFYGISLDKLLK